MMINSIIHSRKKFLHHILYSHRKLLYAQLNNHFEFKIQCCKWLVPTISQYSPYQNVSSDDARLRMVAHMILLFTANKIQAYVFPDLWLYIAKLHLYSAGHFWQIWWAVLNVLNVYNIDLVCQVIRNFLYHLSI